MKKRVLALLSVQYDADIPACGGSVGICGGEH